ncbi:MAG: hypothetical protein Tsb009_36810 [Planctomycetaceae bacterium]
MNSKSTEPIRISGYDVLSRRVVHFAVFGMLIALCVPEASIAADTAVVLEAVGRKPAPLMEKNVPPYLRGALIYQPYKGANLGKTPGARIDFTIQQTTGVCIAVCYKPNGSVRGSLAKQILTHDDLWYEGWLELGRCPWLADHILYYRTCKAGESFRIRTRKYGSPLLMSIKPIDFLDPKLSDLIPVHTLRNLHGDHFIQLLTEKKFDELETLGQRYREKKEKFRDGDSKLALFYGHLGAAGTLKTRKVTDQHWKTRLKLIQSWIKAKPKSKTPQMVLATYHVSYAGFVRGDGWASMVPDEAFRIHDENQKKARDIFLQIEKNYPKDDPAVYTFLIGGASTHGDSRATMNRWLRKSIAIDPTYRPTIRVMAVKLMPRWMGRPGELEKFADEAVKLTKHACGTMMYAVIVEKMSTYEMSSTFDSFAFSWEKTRQGYRDLEKFYPKSRNHLDRFCYLAAQAGDRKTASEVMKKIGNNYRLSHWGLRDRFQRWQAVVQPDVYKGKHKMLFQAHADGVSALDFSRDGKFIASAGFDRNIRLWDAKTGKKLFSRWLRTSSGRCISFSPKANILVVGTSDGRLLLWDFDRRRSGELNGHRAIVSDVSFSPSGKLIASVGYDRQLILWDIETGEMKTRVPTAYGSSIRAVAFSSDEKLVAIAGRGGPIKIYDSQTGELKKEWMVQKGSIITAVTFLPGDKRVVTGDYSGFVKVWELESQKAIATVRPEKTYVKEVRVSPDGKTLAIAISNPKNIQVGGAFLWNMDSQSQPVSVKENSFGINAIRFSPSGKTIATGSYDWSIRLWPAKMPSGSSGK